MSGKMLSFAAVQDHVDIFIVSVVKVKKQYLKKCWPSLQCKFIFSQLLLLLLLKRRQCNVCLNVHLRSITRPCGHFQRYCFKGDNAISEKMLAIATTKCYICGQFHKTFRAVNRYGSKSILLSRAISTVPIKVVSLQP